jgi:hypothetical protein
VSHCTSSPSLWLAPGLRPTTKHCSMLLYVSLPSWLSCHVICEGNAGADSCARRYGTACGFAHN